MLLPPPFPFGGGGWRVSRAAAPDTASAHARVICLNDRRSGTLIGRISSRCARWLSSDLKARTCNAWECSAVTAIPE